MQAVAGPGQCAAARGKSGCAVEKNLGRPPRGRPRRNIAALRESQIDTMSTPEQAGTQIKPIFSYRKHWAQRFGIAPFLPMTREEMRTLGWDSCDIIIVTGDAYIDHPSFGMALVGRLLEAQGFRVGIISQPDWHSAEDFRRLGKPNLFFGVTAGNMDSMVNRYTADKRIRSSDAYTPDAAPDKRPDHAVIVYSQRCREAYPDAPLGALRLLVGHDAALDPARCQGRPAAVRQRRARAGGTRAPPGQGRERQGHPRPARHFVHGAARLAPRGLDRSRFDHRGYAGRDPCAPGSVCPRDSCRRTRR